MENLTIASWNVENKDFHLEKEKSKVMAVLDICSNNDIDIFSIQGSNLRLANFIEEKIVNKSKYYFVSSFESVKPFFCTRKKKKSIEVNPFIVKREDCFGFETSIGLDTKRTYGRLLLYPFVNGVEVLNTVLTNEGEMKYFLKRVNDVRNVYSDINDHNLFVTCSIEGDSSTFINKMDNMSFNYVLCDETLNNYVFIPKQYSIEDIKVVSDYTDLSSSLPVIVKVKK